MSDFFSSIVGSIFGSSIGPTAIPITTNAKTEKAFSDMLAQADQRIDVSTADTKPKDLTATEKFMKYQRMTTAEKYRASYLAEKKLTEDDLKAMTPDERLKIEQEIAERIRERSKAALMKTKDVVS
jgi:hypothetical protein